MLRRSSYKTAVLLIVAVVALSLRIMPHLPNFAAIGALSLLSGYYLKSNLKYWLPLIVVFISDIFIGFYSFPIMIAVYGCYLLGVVLGSLSYRSNVKYRAGTILLATLSGSVIFYLVTNAAVVFAGTMYPHSLHGLLMSYTNAVPFFRNSLAGDLAYTGSIVVAIESLAFLKTKYRRQKTSLLEKV